MNTKSLRCPSCERVIQVSSNYSGSLCADCSEASRAKLEPAQRDQKKFDQGKEELLEKIKKTREKDAESDRLRVLRRTIHFVVSDVLLVLGGALLCTSILIVLSLPIIFPNTPTIYLGSLFLVAISTLSAAGFYKLITKVLCE